MIMVQHQHGNHTE